MEQEQREEIKELCRPLHDELGPFLKAIWIYGSATRKDHVEGSDIDILVLLDDTKQDFDKQTVQKAKAIMNGIDDKAPDDYDLHFQPPKLLSQWWDLIISGEPWAITSMEDAQTIYDESGYIELTRELLQEGRMHGTEQRAHKLLKRSRKKVKKTKKLLLKDVTSELLRAMTEAAQANLMYYGHPPPSPDKIGDELEDEFVADDLLDQRAVDDYRDLYRLTERIDHGKLTEFSGRELDDYLSSALAFIRSMASLFDELEKQKQENIVAESHEEVIELCKEALDAKGVEVPTDDEEVLRQFHDAFVEEGLVSDEHWQTVQKIEQVKEAVEQGKLDQMSEKEIYSSRVYLRDFESTISDLLTEREAAVPEPIEDRDEEQDDITSISAVKDYTEELLSDYEGVIKAIWLLSSDDLKETSDVTAIILYDDINDDENQGEALEKRSRALADEIHDDQNIDIHPSFYKLTDYWNLVRHGSPVTFTEIREGIPVYDPSGFFLPLKKLLKNGKIPGTKEAMRSLIVKAPKRLAKVRNKYKAQVIEQMYNAVVDAGQAALIVHGVSPPVQKRLASELRNHLVEDGVMSETDVERAEEIITYWKDYEHGEIDHIEGDDIDRFMADMEKFIDTVDEILDEA
ncbi:MAG: nucleotidyltransferase domain-containing protein [Candidatus Nanohaloarchaea archaeon]|nr:nucleotidyltransferase domain-containing protein [Candidatus Nanohaloarchaea archaeon]